MSERWPGLPAPDGIDATSVEAEGEGVTVGVLEGGWAVDATGAWGHPVLAHLRTAPPAFNVPFRADHGTRMAGILFGVGPVQGLCPAARPLLVGTFRSSTEEDLVGALEAARLAAGDLLLLEAQVRDPRTGLPLPAEADPAVADAVEALVDRGVVVVAPAGNGGLNLDRVGVPDGEDRRPFDPDHPAFRDTGAILVAAGVRREGAWVRRRGPGSLGSNHGRRVDAFAWGEGVPVPSFVHRHDGPPRPIVDYGGETSAAAAIVAGALARLLSWARGRFVVSPRALRMLLRETGTVGEDGIGRMPDLRRLCAVMESR